jgi:predicted nuclease of restriction endonuclease-like (RecB) superfamily
LYSYLPQAVEDNETIAQQVVAQLVSVPWGHHRTIIYKCKGDRDKALFYVRRTIQNGWSRNSLLNWLSTDLYEREEKCCRCDNVTGCQFQFSMRGAA